MLQVYISHTVFYLYRNSVVLEMVKYTQLDPATKQMTFDLTSLSLLGSTDFKIGNKNEFFKNID